MANTSSQVNPLFPLHPYPEIILQPNGTMIEHVRKGHLKGVQNDPNIVAPSLGNI